MAATSLTADGLLTADTSDMETCDTDEPSKAEEEYFIERERETDLFSNSEQEITNALPPPKRPQRPCHKKAEKATVTNQITNQMTTRQEELNDLEMTKEKDKGILTLKKPA